MFFYSSCILILYSLFRTVIAEFDFVNYLKSIFSTQVNAKRCDLRLRTELASRYVNP